MPRISCIFLFLRLIGAAVVAATLTFAGAAAAQDVDLVKLRRSVAEAQRDARNLDIAIEQRAAENQRLADALDVADVREPVTFAELRQAKFEVDIARTRLSTLDHRLSEQMAMMGDLNAEIIRLTSSNTGAADTLKRVVEEAALDWRSRLRDIENDMIGKLTRFRELSAEYLYLRQEELQILQSEISLDAITGSEGGKADPIIARLRDLVTQLSRTAMQLSNDAASIETSTPAAVERRNLLRLRSDELLLRSTARLTDIVIVEAQNVIDGVRPMIDEPAVPIRLFNEAIGAVDDASDDLGARRSIISDNQTALQDFNRFLTEPGNLQQAATGQTNRIQALRRLLETQDREIGELQDRLLSVRDALVKERAARQRAALLQREVARTDRGARDRIAAEIADIPSELTRIYSARVAEVETAIVVADNERFAVLAGALLVVLALTLWLRQRVLRRFVASRATRATEVPIEVLRRNLFWLFPAAVWGIFCATFAISRSTAVSVFTLLIIPAAAALLRDLTQVIVAHSTEGRKRRIGIIITRSTEVAMVATALVVFVYVVLDEVPLLPSTQTAIDRLAYSVFVLSGLPMLLFVFVFANTGSNSAYGKARRFIAAVLSLLPPVALIATGVTGLAGYTQLANIMLENLGIAIAIAATLALILGVLNDIIEGMAETIREKDPARAYFMRSNFLQPLNRLLQVLLALVAIAVAAHIFGWSQETPGISQLVEVWRTTVFSVGGQGYSIGNVLIATAAFVFVFWAAAWTRRVAYTVIFRHLKDIGIRQSLSVFAQYVVIVLGVLLTLSAVGFDVTTLTVFAASLGVGIGFGLQNVVNNFISGLLLLVERPLRLGDIVTVGANSGTVSQIGIRSMRLTTFDEFDLIVPNSALISDTFTNWTRTNSQMRVLLTVGIAYDNDPEEAIKIVYEILKEHKGVLRSPAPMVTVEEFADSSINLRVCYYIDLRGNYSGFVVKSEVLSAVWRRFAKAGITIPFPQRDLHIINPSGAAPAAVPSQTVPERPESAHGEWVGDAIELAQENASQESAKE
ncbi:mechanosensitive ion channel domain-containing protein [Acuticoccus mangrovi]|uniref:Mechanosensitive ion channel n=1 Tax=Acuticoccus mangrovi TaxID=2796142 RepID=A0A934MH97_9HYPH|nr:mechanosensitive ion channel domain-containing protein [Acuticoccus mangrovi]MBJ3777433.1 mechanosensitive ion channel [Acuticoccus mangrovi]